MIGSSIKRAGGVMPPVRLAVQTVLALGIGLGPCNDAKAFGAFGQVALKKHGVSRGRLDTDTLFGTRGAIRADEFVVAATDRADDMSVAWMLPSRTACPLAEPEAARSAAVSTTARLVRDLFPDMRRPVDVKVYVVPAFVRFRNKARFDLSSARISLEVGMSVPCRSDTASADLMSVLVHELTHVRLWAKNQTPNKFSNEAIAHSVHAAAWWRMRGLPPDFRKFPYEDNMAPAGERWSRLFRGSRPRSDRAGRVAQFALASLPAAEGAQVASAETVTAYVRCLLDERPDFKKGNPAAVFAETRGQHCSPNGKPREKLAGP